MVAGGLVAVLRTGFQTSGIMVCAAVRVHVHVHVHVHIYVYMYVCMYVCMSAYLVEGMQRVGDCLCVV